MEHHAEVIQARREIGEEGVGLACREAPSDVDGLLRRGQRLLASAEGGEPAAEVSQARRENGERGVGSVFREAPSDVDGLLRRGQRLLAAAEGEEYVGEVSQARYEIGEEGVGLAFRQAPIEFGRYNHKRMPLAERIRWACEAGLPRGAVLMDAGYGVDTDLRARTVWAPGTGPRPPKKWSGQ